MEQVFVKTTEIGSYRLLAGACQAVRIQIPPNAIQAIVRALHANGCCMSGNTEAPWIRSLGATDAQQLQQRPAQPPQTQPPQTQPPQMLPQVQSQPDNDPRPGDPINPGLRPNAPHHVPNSVPTMEVEFPRPTPPI